MSDRHSRRSRSVSISEQKRPLLLPQEIKELGRDREILIYEGLRPILAKKNRYFQDRRLRTRLLPPPTCASPQVGSIAAGASRYASSPFQSESIDQFMEPRKRDESRKPRRRKATLKDIERIDSFTLDDFAVDWSRVEIPQKAEGERLTSDELQRAADSFLAAMREH